MSPRSIIISSTLAFLLWYNGLINGTVIDLTPVPFQTDKLSVLVIEETEDSTKMPGSQIVALGTLRQMVEQKGGEYLQLDDDISLDNYKQWARDAMSVKRESLPWVVGSNGRKGFSKPAPKTEPEATKLLEGY
jgi:hypothetical protein